MATQPTNLPVPSESPRDLKFNAGKIDEFATSLLYTYTDRFGNEHYTIEGINRIALQAISNFGYITLDSFEDGNTITLPNQVLRYEANGEYYRWDGTLPKTVPAGSTPESSGGVGPGKWVSVGDASLRGDLASHDLGRGASLVSLNNAGSVQDAIKYATPEMFLSSSSDITAAIQSAVDNYRIVVLSPSDYTITRTISIPDGTTIIMSGSRLIADCGSNPVFSFEGKVYGLTMVGDSGLVTGTASAFLLLTGTSDTPANSDYVKQVRLHGINISSATITTSVVMKKAVRQVFIDSSMFYTKNGIEADGKTVEVTINKSIIYGATTDTDSFGIKLSSTGGTKYYNEGWHISDCTVDNFANTLDLADIFAFTVSKGYIACNATTAFAITIRPPTTTTHTREIQLDSIFGGKIRFLDTVTGTTIFHTKITGEITNCKPGTCISIGANAAAIDIRSLRATSSTGCTLSSVANASANINYSDISTDSSLATGIVFNGEDGSNCSISDYLYSGTGEALSLARAVKLSNVPAIGVNTLSWLVKYDYVTTSKDVAVGAYINQLQMTIARYSKIEININLSYSGGAASNAQAIGITVPNGVILPNGANSMLFTLPATAGSLTMSIVATTTLDFKNLSFSIDNRAGNQLRILAGSHLSVSLAN
ncbi:hypothetical protein M2R49_13830 [Citrobacter amalonaticus]|uniref:tail fiber/spike domain-containing protein n=1 Tax=Citrobacter amalonaticus TaxID=35703 RepID=UPI0021E1D6B1|nr:hypothetical protein [Citrobacter amalonaticus]UYF53903.1 hypothetical protein M2R49_13830 [Citrobacter amalonaticus]